MRRIFSSCFLFGLLMLGALLPRQVEAQQTGLQDRAYWSALLYKMASPVVMNMANGTLRSNMPVEKAPGYALKAEKVTYLEAVGRTMAGIAPWLALPDDNSPEGKQRRQLREALLRGISHGVNLLGVTSDSSFHPCGNRCSAQNWNRVPTITLRPGTWKPFTASKSVLVRLRPSRKPVICGVIG